jgi:hypothetical protein
MKARDRGADHSLGVSRVGLDDPVAGFGDGGRGGVAGGVE